MRLPSTIATFAVPIAATSVAGIAAVIELAETNVVVLSLPFQRTCELAVKPPPETVSVKAGTPAATVEGLSAEREGACFTGGGVIPEEPPPQPVIKVKHRQRTTGQTRSFRGFIKAST